MPETLAGTGILIRLGLRRDRWLLPFWIAGFALVTYSTALAGAELYPDMASRVEAATALNATASMVALFGRIYDPTSIGALSLIKYTAFMTAILAVLMVILAIRHTRGDEESGRLELLGGGSWAATLRWRPRSPSASAPTWCSGCSRQPRWLPAGYRPQVPRVRPGLGCDGDGVQCRGGPGCPADGQCPGRHRDQRRIRRRHLCAASSGRPGRAGALGAFLAVAHRVEPADPGIRRGPLVVLALPVALCLVLVPAAFALRARRDLGAGLRAERPGPSAGSLSGVWDLAVRLQYRVLLAWAVAFLLFGVVIGSLVSNVGELLNSPNAQDLIKLLGGREALTDAFLAAEISIMGVLAAAFGVSAANHLRSEESAGHTEALLGTATTRIRWASSHFVFALAGVAVLLLLAGVSIGVGAAFAVDDAALVGRSTVAAVAQVPAAWVVTSAALAVFGWAPRLAGAVWGLLLALVALGEFGVLWNAPEWLMDLSPFRHSPLLPVDSGGVPALAALVVAAAALAALGYAGWRRRDLAA